MELFKSGAYCNNTFQSDNSTSEELCFASIGINGSHLYHPSMLSSLDTLIVFACFIYGIICLAGAIGNGLVVYVVARYAKMRSVPNMYLLNLAVSDLCYLILLPFLIVTALRKMWMFGEALCKLFYIMTSLNWFASVFTLIVMSADRYMAVCHPVSSIRYRTPGISLIVCLSVWVVSTLFMLPICIYAEAVEERGVISCTISWPKTDTIPPDKAFIWYAMLIGFAIPMVLISAFYILVILRLKSCGPKKKNGQRHRTSNSHRRVTRMVLAVVTVHVVCWLPYWIFQVVLTFKDDEFVAPQWQVLAFQFATIFSYTNSVFNPLLYAFLGDNFRQTFARAITCKKYHARLSMRTSDMSCRSNRTIKSFRNTDSDKKKETKTKPEQDDQPILGANGNRFLVPGEINNGLLAPERTAVYYGHYHVSSSAVSVVEDMSRHPGLAAVEHLEDDVVLDEPGKEFIEEGGGGGAAPIEVGLRETEF